MKHINAFFRQNEATQISAEAASITTTIGWRTAAEASLLAEPVGATVPEAPAPVDFDVGVCVCEPAAAGTLEAKDATGVESDGVEATGLASAGLVVLKGATLVDDTNDEAGVELTAGTDVIELPLALPLR